MSDRMEQRESAEQLLDKGLSAIRAAYYTDVREYAEEIKQAIVDGEISDRDALSERIHETVDGTQWVIYTFKAQIVCLASDNDGAYADGYGPEGMVTDGAINWSAIAYAAMERDVIEALEALDVNMSGDDRAELLGEEEEDDADDEGTCRICGKVRPVFAWSVLGNECESCFKSDEPGAE